MCIYCDYCVYHYKSTELVSSYDIGYWTLNKYYYYIDVLLKYEIIFFLEVSVYLFILLR